jgi:hypothetical protein
MAEVVRSTIRVDGQFGVEIGDYAVIVAGGWVEQKPFAAGREVELNQTGGHVRVTRELREAADQINRYEGARESFRQEMIEQGMDPASEIVDLDQGSDFFDENGDFVGWGSPLPGDLAPDAEASRQWGASQLSDLLRKFGEGTPFSVSPRYADVLGSGNILEAEDLLRSGQAVPDHYFLFPDYERKIRLSDSELLREKSADSILTFLIAAGIEMGHDFSLVIYQESEDLSWLGGPWLEVHSTATRVEVSLMSNHQHLEYKESWFSATLSLFAWTTLPTGGAANRLYRKVWESPVDPVGLAAACSLVLLHVFQCLRVPRLALVTTLTDDSIFSALPTDWQIRHGVRDLTLSHRYATKTRSQGMVPPPTRVDPVNESSEALISIERAEGIADSMDDMVGIETLADVRSRVQRRTGYEEQMCREVRLVLDSLGGGTSSS